MPTIFQSRWWSGLVYASLDRLRAKWENERQHLSIASTEPVGYAATKLISRLNRTGHLLIPSVPRLRSMKNGFLFFWERTFGRFEGYGLFGTVLHGGKSLKNAVRDNETVKGSSNARWVYSGRCGSIIDNFRKRVENDWYQKRQIWTFVGNLFAFVLLILM